MAKNTRWSIDDFKRLNLVEHEGTFKPVAGLTAKSVSKIDPKQFLAEVQGKTGNSKVKNATKVEVNGIKFDSKLESYFYSQLQALGVTFEFQKEYVLQDKFRYRSEAIRQLKIIVDFDIPCVNMIVDTKGWQTTDNKLKQKLLKWHLHQLGRAPEIELPRNKKECDTLINKIHYEIRNRSTN